MEIAIAIVAILIGIGLLVALSPLIAIGSFAGAIYFFTQGNIWAGIGLLVLTGVSGAIANAMDGGPVYVILRR